MTSSMLILSEPDAHVLVEAKHVCTVAEGYWLSVEGILRIDDEKKKSRHFHQIVKNQCWRIKGLWSIELDGLSWLVVLVDVRLSSAIISILIVEQRIVSRT